MGDKKGKSKAQPQDKVWDRVFKTMLQEQPALFIPLINLVFEKQYERNVPITSINTEAYNKDRSKIMSDISFLIQDKTYHFECQYSNDKTMAFRMFEYDFHIALTDAKRTDNFTEFNFPRSCVFYIVPKGSIPDHLELKVNFADASYRYKVPVIRLYDYDLDKIEQNELFLFLPYEILRHTRNVTTEKHISKYAEEIKSVYGRMIEILKKAYSDNKVNDCESLTLIDMMNDTAGHKLKKYPQIWEEVNEMLNREYVPRWKLELEQARREITKEVTEKVTEEVTEKVTEEVTEKVTEEVTEKVTEEVTEKVTEEVTEKVTEEVTEKVTKKVTLSEAVETIQFMKENGIQEEFIRKFAERKKVPTKTVDDILNSSESKKSVQI